MTSIMSIMSSSPINYVTFWSWNTTWYLKNGGKNTVLVWNKKNFLWEESLAPLAYEHDHDSNVISVFEPRDSYKKEFLQENAVYCMPSIFKAYLYHKHKNHILQLTINFLTVVFSYQIVIIKQEINIFFLTGM